MAAMAPALTDTPAEAHRIRFKLAPPTSTLSPSGVEANASILVSSNGGVKHKASEAGPCKPLVTSYHCSDVTSAQESLDLEGVLRQKRSILPAFIPHKLSEEQLKSIMSGPPLLQGGTVNGVAKKALNGGQRSASLSIHNSHQPVRRNGPCRAEEAELRSEPFQNCPANGEALPSRALSDTPSDRPLEQPDPSGALGAELGDRTLHSHTRQGEIEARLRRLRKRLQVVQAKQVERHVQQQLGGLVEGTLGALDSRRPRGRYSDALTPQERDGLGRFLKSGSMPAELERLALSGTANLRSAESAFDSDATESSSGGDSDVEEDELARIDIEQCHIPIWRRAEGRYAVDRAAIISHWNWLQAQVSDLEYRIRQQTDIYRQIRSSKGSVVLGETVPDDRDWRTDPIPCPASREHDDIGVEESVRSCAPVQQVNPVIGSLRVSSSVSTDPAECQTDVTSAAARTRPLAAFRKRRILRPGSLSSISRKSVKSVSPHCGCELNSQCVMCSGRALPPADAPHQLPLLDRLSHFDPSVHPILSFTDDVMMSLHMQRVLKGNGQLRPLEKIKPIRKISLKHKLLSGRFADKHKLGHSLLSAVRFSHHKARSEKTSRQQLDVPMSVGKLDSRQQFRHSISFDRSRKRPREPSLQHTDGAPKLYMELGSPSQSVSALHTPTNSPLMRPMLETPLHLSSSSATIRRRRGESPFDINNIVIPMSVAATTRVEKLQYKEILTPSWREVDIFAKPISREDDDAEVEDLSDAAFSQLHLAYETQERSRWSWTACSNAMRRGSRLFKSVDGRTTPLLCGTNPSTPQPSSPDTPHFHLLHDYSSAPSPSSPVSPEMLLLSASRDAHEDTRCSTPEPCEEPAPQPVQPWESRTFPLDADPTQEPETQCVDRNVRRLSKSESDAGPSSLFADDLAKQKPTHR